MKWYKTKKKLPQKGRLAVVVDASLSDVGIDVACSNTDFIGMHPERYSDWAYITYPEDFRKRKFKRLASEYGAKEARYIMGIK